MKTKSFFNLFLFLIPSFLFSQSLLWEISTKNTKQPSYLYGTIHIQDQRVFNYSDSVEIAIKACDAFALEILLDEIDSKTIMSLMTMKTSLDKLLSPEDYKFVKDEVSSKYGFNILMFNKMKPFFISSQLMAGKMKQDMPTALDPFLLAKARKLNKKCLGIEKFEHQISAIDKISLEEQAKMLVEELKDTTSQDAKFDELLDTYLEMDIEKMIELSKDTTLPKNFEKAFLIDRNIKMAKNIHKQIRKQPIFVAIGAAHLGGKNGIIYLLRKKGYTIRPVGMSFVEVKNK
ncbi:MAG: TraB/GumN family protein [Bacteroidales bacterium]|nr:TraB/GumN family protein [Bacteroidales bacterium]